MVKGFRTMAVLTMISRFLGFARDTAYAIVFGPGPVLDAWLMAFKIPNLGRRLFGEGAASASVIPVYSEQLHQNPSQGIRLARTVLSVLFVVLTAIVLAGEIIVLCLYFIWGKNIETKLVLALTSVTMPYMILICMVAVVAGLLNVHKHFAAPALAPIIMNLCIIGSAVLAAVMYPVIARNGGAAGRTVQSFSQPEVRQIFIVAVAVIVAGIFEFAVQLPPFFRSGLSLRPAWQTDLEPFKRILRLMLPMIIGLAVTQINTLMDDLVAWWFSGSPEKGEFFNIFGHNVRYPMWRGSISYLNFAQHLYQFPLGIFGISLATALFPVMSGHAARKDHQGLRKIVASGVRCCIFIAIPCSVGLLLVARPFISVWLRHGNFQVKDVPEVIWPLGFYACGITGYFLQQIIVRAFHSLQDPVPPVRTGLLAVAMNFCLNVTLIWFLGTGGLAASTALCSYLQVAILVFILRKRLGNSVLEGALLTIAKTVGATALMAAAAMAVYRLGSRWHDAVKLAAVVPVSAAVFLAAAWAMRVPELALLTGKRFHKADTGNATVP